MLDKMHLGPCDHGVMVNSASLNLLLNPGHEICVVGDMTLGGLVQNVADELVDTAV